MSKEVVHRVRIVQDVTAQSPDEDMCDDVVLVNYHRDFYVKRDDIITEEQVRAYYRSEWAEGLDEVKRKYYFFQLSMLSHGGVWLSLNYKFLSDPQGWDTSHVGLVLVEKAGAKGLKKAYGLAQSLVDTWNMYLQGDVWGYVVEKKKKCEECGHVEWEHVDSCWGIFGADRVEDEIPEKYRSLIPERDAWELGG